MTTYTIEKMCYYEDDRLPYKDAVPCIYDNYNSAFADLLDIVDNEVEDLNEGCKAGYFNANFYPEDHDAVTEFWEEVTENDNVMRVVTTYDIVERTIRS